jgi:hypothetical protein
MHVANYVQAWDTLHSQKIVLTIPTKGTWTDAYTGRTGHAFMGQCIGSDACLHKC